MAGPIYGLLSPPAVDHQDDRVSTSDGKRHCKVPWKQIIGGVVIAVLVVALILTTTFLVRNKDEDQQPDVNECGSNPCRNGGICTDGDGFYQCSCKAGFTGNNCLKNVNECVSNPCRNGGSCTDQDESYQCSCKAGFTGDNCVINVNECGSSPCRNGGNCTDDVDRYQCSCPTGYTGDNCDINVNECGSNPCRNGGNCTDGVDRYQCSCPTGYTGDNCNISVPMPEDQCALPTHPVVSTGDSSESGTRLGSNPESRFEYTSFPINIRFNFSIEYKTSSNNGVILYMADEREVDFVAIYMKDGLLNYGFDCGSSTALITSMKTYNDGQWHIVEFSRESNAGQMIIDYGGSSGEELTGRAEGQSRSINVVTPYYVGGLSLAATQVARGNLNDMTLGFTGCLKNLLLNGQEVGPPAEQFHTQACSSAVEVGSFFYTDGGYLKLYDNFKVGLDLDVKMEIRPRSLNGVLLSVYSLRGYYMVLQLVDGHLVFSVDNGGGEIKAEHKSPAKNDLCDGQWHTIAATKAKNVVTMNVDSVYSYPGIGEAGESSTDTSDPLYIGGVPEIHPGIKSSGKYVGCIRNVQLGTSVINMADADMFGHVDISSCPTT